MEAPSNKSQQDEILSIFCKPIWIRNLSSQVVKLITKGQETLVADLGG